MPSPALRRGAAPVLRAPDARGAGTAAGADATAGAGTGPLRGVGVSVGIAHGPVARLGEPARVPADLPEPADAAAEQRAVREALEAAAAALEERAGAARDRGREEAAMILDAQAMMGRDPVLADRAAALVEEGRPGPVAVSAALQGFREQLEAAGGYLAERAADLDGLRDRVVAVLLGVPLPGLPEPGHPYVLLAEDLTPADTATLDPAEVLGIVTAAGGATGHTAIIAKSLGIPAIVGCAGSREVPDGTTVLVDGGEGLLLADATEDDVRERRGREAARRAAAAAHRGPGATKDGHAVKLLVNLGAEQDAAEVADHDVEGVGLLRTELLYLDRTSAPSHAEQVAAFRSTFTAFSGRKVVVRTLDAGADKPLRFLTDPDEPNPALGVRGYRTARRHPELLAGQLDALAEAAEGSGAEVWVMAPMVATPAEAAEFAGLCHERGIQLAGTMVEVPSAALQADALLAGCDFVSLGTNDLSQYAFAADRLQSELGELLDPWQPALLRLVEMTGAAGRRAGKSVGVCGEAASDPLLALVLTGLGVTSLSMAVGAVPDVRAALAAHTLEQCEALARLALEAPDAAHGREAVAQGAATPRAS